MKCSCGEYDLPPNTRPPPTPKWGMVFIDQKILHSENRCGPAFGEEADDDFR